MAPTLVCLVEMLSWDLEPWQRGLSGLGGMYGAYLAVGMFMHISSTSYSFFFLLVLRDPDLLFLFSPYVYVRDSC